MIEREALYQMLAAKQWDAIARVLHKNAAEISTDPIAQQAIHFFETEFFADLADKAESEAFRLLELPHLIVQLSPRSFSPEFTEKLVTEKMNRLRKSGQHDRALEVAIQHQWVPVCQAVIAETDSQTPEVFADRRRQNTTVHATTVSDSPSATRTLFRSKQEENFFHAMRGAFPTYDPYPNVAINAVIEFDAVRGQLSSAEREFFFKGLIDSVVFDPGSSYSPLYFFELDSLHHDSESQRRRDSMKDNIFKSANAKLHRIRSTNSQGSSVEAFRDLILEFVRGL